MLDRNPRPWAHDVGSKLRLKQKLFRPCSHFCSHSRSKGAWGSALWDSGCLLGTGTTAEWGRRIRVAVPSGSLD